MLNNRRFAVIVLASVVTVGLAAATALRFTSEGNALELMSRSDSASSIQRSDIIARVTKMTAIVKTVTRIDAKSTTWGQYLQSHDTGDTFLIQPTPLTTPVWVVAVSGEFLPPHGKGSEVYKWGVIVFDANNGDWLQTEASYQSAWPAFFGQLR